MIANGKRRHKYFYFFFLWLLSFLSTPFCLAYDIDPHYKFSGVKSPESPYKNTWGAFQTNLFSGSFGYDYKIEVPPGTNGLTPKLTISYNSHSAKGKSGWVGSGWDIPLSYIQRDIEYTRKDTADDTFDLFLEGAKHDLVYVASEIRYHTKIESYMKVEKKTGAPNTKGEYWMVTTTDGMEFRFGYNTDSENLVRSSDASFTAYAWRWSLDQITDPNGNCIYFTYTEDQGSVYLNKIEYNTEKKRLINFILEAKPDAYLVIDQGSEVYDAFRLKEITISLNGGLVRKYALNYALNEIGTRSLLTAITQYGSDGTTSLPPVKFEYKSLDAGFNNYIEWNTPAEKVIRKVDNNHNDTIGDTFDVNGDGLPDVVRYDETQAVYDNWNVWLNTGSGFSETALTWHIFKDGAIRNNNVLQCEPEYDDEVDPNTKTAPMDINNDGYIDFLKADGDGKLEFRINSGSNFSDTTNSWTLPFSAFIRDVRNPCDGDAPNAQQTFFDINGDTLPDLVNKEKVDDLWYWHIWRNTGNGFVDFGLWRVRHNVGEIEDFTRGDTTNTEASHYDINGDGLVDSVIAYDSIWRIWLNTGSNFIDGGQWDTRNTSFDNINDTDDDGQVTRDLIDINGDGLPDIVNPVADVRDWEVCYNTGKGFTEKKYWYVPADVSQNGFITKIEKSDDLIETTRDVLDIDGDGGSDLIRKFSDHWKVYPNKAGTCDLLSKITDTLGGTVGISYNTSAKYSNTRLPFNFWVVGSTSTDNGMTGGHALTSATTFSYANGLYDFSTKEFRGFGQVTETKADGTKVIHNYYQDEAKKGKEYQTDIKNSANAPYAGTANTWSESSANNIFISNLSRTDEFTYDGNPSNPKTSRKEFQNYDSYGNIGLQINYGDLNTSGDEAFSYNEYWPPCDSGIWVANKIRHTYITASAGGAKLRESFFWYNEQTTCAGKGNLTREEHWLDGGVNPVSLYQYDIYGNRTQATDPEERVTRIEYDATYHTFPEKTFNPKNQMTTKIFNPATGEVMQETDPNGYVVSYVFDVFNRKIKEIRPYDNTGFPTANIGYFIDGTAPEYVIVSKRETPGAPGTLDTIQSIDGFGSLIQTKSEYENPANMIATDVYYDVMGRVKKQSNPYLTDNNMEYSTPSVTAAAIVYSYDSLGRPTGITNPDATTISRSFDHWTVTETDENGHAKSYQFDAAQRLKQVVENNLGASYTTHYVYNPLGELTQITDHPGNITTIFYDTLGRKTQMADPDMGIWNYAYDGAGNLVSQTDAKGTTTNIQYDPLNRKTLVNYPTSPDIQLTYDINTIGTLSQVSDSVGSVSYLYDQRLRKIQEARTMDAMTWTTAWAYDSLDRMLSMTYPDGEAVHFTYNAQGKLDGIPGIVTGMDYNAAGQTTVKNYANGKSTSYTYDNKNLRLTKRAASGIQGLSYTYDSVGNIKSIVDTLTYKLETFDYDDLDRLIQAGDSAYNLKYQYDSIGNMTSVTKNGQTRTYNYGTNTEGPHAVKGVSCMIPVAGAFVINNGDAVTTTNKVSLNNVSYGTPTLYMVSENFNFSGASWKPYSENPEMLLSAGFGIKTIYFKVKNADGESVVKSDMIDFRLNPADEFLDDDGDNLTNKEEYEHGSDSNDLDTDDDGWGDYEEIVVYQSDPAKADTDDDGLIDPGDPYPKDPYHAGISENYSFKHGIMNEGGNSRTGDDFLMSGDRLGDAASRKTFQDTDDDGIPDKDDLDTDNDGMPNDYEILHGLNPLDVSDGMGDLDGDHLKNYDEYFHNTDPQLKDTDNDGLNDYLEVKIFHSDPSAQDTDNDGLKDGQDPYPLSIYHISVSENHSLRKTSFNEGGNVRIGISFLVQDEIGNDFSRDGIFASTAPCVPITDALYKMAAYGIAYDGDQPAVSGDWICIYGKGGEDDCRAIIQVGENGAYYARIAGKTNGEELWFRLFQNIGGQFTYCEEKIIFQSDGTEFEDLHFGLPAPHIPGDVNYDGHITLTDAILALQITTGITPLQAVFKEADVSGDGKIGLEEVIYALGVVAGIYVPLNP